MKTLKLVVLTLAVLLLPSLSLAQQNTLGQTTLSAAISGQYLGPGPTGNVPAPTLIQVTSATGMVGINPNLGITASQPNQTELFVGREAMLVQAVNGNTLTVVRGYGGTVATPHVSGDMVLFGQPRFFYVNDPGAVPTAPGSIVSNVSCTAANVVVTPWVNIRTGAQWICSTDTLAWVPGFNNNSSGSLADVPSAGTEASVAGTNAVLGPVFAISGTNAIVTFTPPVGFNATAVGGGCFTVIPKGIFTWTAAGNISVAGTTTAITQNVSFCWNPYTSKWVPSRIA